MFQNDYMMRKIEMMARAIAKFVFGKDTAEYEIIRDEDGRITEISLFCLRLREMADEGQIGEAEDLLFKQIDDKKETAFLEVGLDFYEYVNGKSDTFLDESDFSREEVNEGVSDLLSQYDISGF